MVDVDPAALRGLSLKQSESFVERNTPKTMLGNLLVDVDMKNGY